MAKSSYTPSPGFLLQLEQRLDLLIRWAGSMAQLARLMGVQPGSIRHWRLHLCFPRSLSIRMRFDALHSAAEADIARGYKRTFAVPSKREESHPKHETGSPSGQTA